jgi:hypothetical protein
MLASLLISRQGFNAFSEARENASAMNAALLHQVAEQVAGSDLEQKLPMERVFELIKLGRLRLDGKPRLSETYDDRLPKRRIREGKKLLPRNMLPKHPPKL